MRTDDFWSVIDRARADTPATPADVAERAVAELAAKEPDEIVAWGRHLHKVLSASFREDLWAAAYLINGGCSDDGFDHFRGWLLAHGRDVFARAVREPDSLAELPAVRAAAATGAEFAGQEILAIAVDAHRRATGQDPPHDPYGPEQGRDTDTFWDFDDEDEMQRRLPRLSALFLAEP